MKPVKFEGLNVIFAEDQPEYNQLPAYKDKEGNIITEWKFTKEEIEKISNGENLRIAVSTFNKPLQPILPYIDSLIEIYQKELTEPEISDKETYPNENEALNDIKNVSEVIKHPLWGEFLEFKLNNSNPSKKSLKITETEEILNENSNIIKIYREALEKIKEFNNKPGDVVKSHNYIVSDNALETVSLLKK